MLSDNLLIRAGDAPLDRRRRQRREQVSRIETSNDNHCDTRPLIHCTSHWRPRGCWMEPENAVSNQIKPLSTPGYLLLRDGHAVPLHGISPDHIKAGAKERVSNLDIDSIRHRQCLTAIVDRLGFAGDFGTFQQQGWPEFQRFLNRKGCTRQAGLFPSEHGGCIDLHFGTYGGPRPRELADRIFADSDAIPTRVFLGYGVDWQAWDSGNGIVAPVEAIASIGADENTAAQYAKELFGCRHDLAGQWGFLDDKLIDGPLLTVVDKSYWPPGSSKEERHRHLEKVTAAVKAFRKVFDSRRNGWVDVLPYNNNLVVLRAHDGCWNVLWRNYRETEPPRAMQSEDDSDLDVEDMPSCLRSQVAHQRAIYLRQDLWDEREKHDAEQAFYDRGGSIPERQMTDNTAVMTVWLRQQGKLPVPEFVSHDRDLPPGFSVVALGGRVVAVSEMISVGAFRSMLRDSGYDERQRERSEPWSRANEDVSNEMPVGASWFDAQAFCAWKEKELGVMLRLPTRDELRTLRPAFSPHYERLAMLDFPWEHYPPRPILDATRVMQEHEVPSAVAWSEPRFLGHGKDVPEFPEDSGLSLTSRKLWITDFPPRAPWKSSIPIAQYYGLTFIDAWDTCEWCQEKGWVSGRFWEGAVGASSWGGYKNMKTTFRLVMDIKDLNRRPPN